MYYPLTKKELELSPSHPTGIYIFNHGSVYKKTLNILTGYLYNSHDVKMEKLGRFITIKNDLLTTMEKQIVEDFKYGQNVIVSEWKNVCEKIKMEQTNESTDETKTIKKEAESLEKKTEELKKEAEVIEKETEAIKKEIATKSEIINGINICMKKFNNTKDKKEKLFWGNKMYSVMTPEFVTKYPTFAKVAKAKLWEFDEAIKNNEENRKILDPQAHFARLFPHAKSFDAIKLVKN